MKNKIKYAAKRQTQIQPVCIITTNEKPDPKMDKSNSRKVLTEMGLSDEDIHLLETGTIEQRALMLTKRGYPMLITEKITIGDHMMTRTFEA